MPFRMQNQNNDKSVCWTSNKAASTTAFGYTYEEVQPGGSNRDVWQRINDEYQWSVPLTAAGKLGPIPPKMKPFDLSGSDFFKTHSQEPIAETALLSSIAPASLQHVQTVMKAERAITTPIAEPDYSREWYIDDEVER